MTRARRVAELGGLFGACSRQGINRLVVVGGRGNRGGSGLVDRSRFYARGGVMDDWIRVCAWLAFSGALLFITFLIFLPMVD